MNFLRSVLHMLWMVITVIPWATLVVVVSPFMSQRRVYWLCAGWLRTAVRGGEIILGIRNRITGMENLPQGEGDPAVLLVKHQSTWETFLMPAIMPHPLAYVFKRELLRIPFFGWAIGRLDMIHIDRSKGSEAFNKVVQQGKRLTRQGVWVIMFPEGTRIPRGEKGKYRSGGTRLAIECGAPVVPIAVTSAKVWPRKAFVKRPGVVDISIGKPIPSTGRKADELMREVEAWIEAEMVRLDPEAYPDGQPRRSRVQPGV
ncbi:lysophospholipid acyltransferase family protein [Ottowia sp.]|uniref:lysophospholipid acyltransferase family protein n=1 Tax=Ottowia sp. TaxID=1898956 RepID=UPI001D7CDD76|nr:lysophospholipid acyltransferase family protein [Ottowia sp.]MCB2026352.1 1-acyl-sn-glycerol-3-phosphate acyltransferase [Ottowia sp.]MCP5256716.1 1-acyl-sn-glycerol-3-phosphate acyltransferase [Burkholderiaceae bacterium]HPR45922.1 lysophospholipid acyltransferase family protein [Ottowia sp.]HRW73006.1 lysophospholipid acyltransferase family protein [Ottowia sp.]